MSHPTAAAEEQAVIQTDIIVSTLIGLPIRSSQAWQYICREVKAAEERGRQSVQDVFGIAEQEAYRLGKAAGRQEEREDCARIASNLADCQMGLERSLQSKALYLNSDHLPRSQAYREVAKQIRARGPQPEVSE